MPSIFKQIMSRFKTVRRSPEKKTSEKKSPDKKSSEKSPDSPSKKARTSKIINKCNILDVKDYDDVNTFYKNCCENNKKPEWAADCRQIDWEPEIIERDIAEYQLERKAKKEAEKLAKLEAEQKAERVKQVRANIEKRMKAERKAEREAEDREKLLGVSKMFKTPTKGGKTKKRKDRK